MKELVSLLEQPRAKELSVVDFCMASFYCSQDSYDFLLPLTTEQVTLVMGYFKHLEKTLGVVSPPKTGFTHFSDRFEDE